MILSIVAVEKTKAVYTVGVKIVTQNTKNLLEILIKNLVTKEYRSLGKSDATN